MTKQNLLTLLVVVLCMWSNAIKAETEIKEETMDRVALCMNNYEKLFGGIALNGQGNDPEMMAILQKFIFGEVFANELLDIKQREMITCVALSSMQTLPQLKAHVGAALNVGVTPIEMRELI